jgi:hypothetical protein
LDKSFDRVKLSNVEVGRNELIIECDYCHWMELEDCYLVGKFGVNTNMEITTEPKKLMLGDWCKQGYKFYIGSMKYNYELDVDLKDNTKYILKLNDYNATNVVIWVNDSLAGNIPWASANGLNISSCLKQGINKITVEVVSSPRNMLGPFHTIQNVGDTTDWSSFRSEDETLLDEYITKPYGLMKPVEILMKR